MNKLPHISPYLLLTLANLFWGGNWVISRAFRGKLLPVALSFWRWMVALLCLLTVSLPHVRRVWPQLRAAWHWLLQGRRLHGREATGILVSLVGVLEIVAHGELQRLRDLTLNVGDFWILTSVLAWSAYTLLLSHRPKVHPLAFLTAINITGLLFQAPFYAWKMARRRHINASPGSIAAIVYTGFGPAFPGYILWNRGVAEVGTARAGIWLNTRRRP